jgi:hypothetical protein
MSIRRSAAFALALFLAYTSALQASDTTFVSQGARVRVKFEQETPVADPSGAISYRLETVRRVGTATNLDSDTLVFLPEDAETAVGIPSSKIEQIEVSQGRKSNWLKSGLIGGGIGLALGAGFGALIQSTCDGGCSGAIAGFGGIGAAFGFGVGAGVGAASKSDRWVEAELPAPSPVALNVGNDGSVRLAFSLRL